MKPVMGIVRVLVVLILVWFAVVWGLQRRVLYPRPPVPPTPPMLPANVTQVWLGPERTTEAWLLRPDDRDAAFPVLIFTHGNGELIDDWLAAFHAVPEMGAGALLLEYPGYGRSGGTPSEESIREAIVAAYDWVRKQPGVDPTRIVAYGRSLGGGPACALARERKVAALVLESSFTSVSAIARRLGVPRPLVRDRYDNLTTVASLDVPVLVVHGERDTIIPVSHGEELARAAGVELVRLPCGHNDCPRPWDEIRGFLRANGL